MVRKLGKIGVYGPKTRNLQRRLSFEAFGLTFKLANVWKYLGPKDGSGINGIPTKVFWEVPDRLYCDNIVQIPIGMEPMNEAKADFSRFGYIDPLQNETMFRVHIDDFEPLGRELVIGDVFEIEFFVKNGKRAYWEITDVDLKQEYEKFIAIIYASPLGDSRTTVDIPVEQSNEPMIDNFMDELDQELSNQVPVEGTTFDPEPVPEPVDYRDKKQSSFLDDPTKQF